MPETLAENEFPLAAEDNPHSPPVASQELEVPPQELETPPPEPDASPPEPEAPAEEPDDGQSTRMER